MRFKHASTLALALALGISPLVLSEVANAQQGTSGGAQSQQGTSGQGTESNSNPGTPESTAGGSREDRCAQADAPADCPEGLKRPPKTEGASGDNK